jgi:hypothetical protein
MLEMKIESLFVVNVVVWVQLNNNIMIKIEHTKIHLISKGSTRPVAGIVVGHAIEILVTDAELLLVEYSHGDTPNKAGEICRFPYGLNIAAQDDMGYPVIKPILISRTEKITSNKGKEMGDWTYNTLYKKIFQMNGDITEYDFKILALPEHFSLQQLQDIVDGKLKEGKCLVECGDIGYYSHNDDKSKPLDKGIKLNPHITIYPVEERLYTKEEMINIFNRYILDYEGIESFRQWFEKNIK